MEATITLTGNIRFSTALRVDGASAASSYFAKLGQATTPAFATGDGNVNAGLFFTVGGGGDMIAHMSGKGVEAQSWTDIVSTFFVDIDMGANDILNVGTVDGVDISAHAARHESGGADQVDHDLLLGFDIAKHRIINDAGFSLLEMWSASKIDSDPRLKSRRIYLSFALPSGVAGGGFASLEHEGVLTSAVGIRLPSAATLIGISYSADATPGGARTYDVDFVSDPAGAPAVLGALAIDNSESDDARRDLSVAIAAGVFVGVEMNRTAGAGGSSFSEALVEIELEVDE